MLFQAKEINSTLLADDVEGRIDITSTFYGRELNTEYLFGLFANLATTPGQASPSLHARPVELLWTEFTACLDRIDRMQWS